MSLRRASAPLVVLALALALTGCGIASPAPTVTVTTTPSPRPTPSATAAGGAAPEVVGTCAPGDDQLSATYVVWSSRADRRIEVTVDAFQKSGGVTKVTRQVTGPSITLVSYPCTDAGNQPWTLTASTTGDASLYCQILSYTGVVAEDHHFDGTGGAPSVTCRGNPGGP